GAIVGSVELLALPGVGENRDSAGLLVADDAAIAVLEGDLPVLEIERVAVAVAGRLAEDADVAVFVQPAELPVVRNIAPDEILSLRVPGRPFGPEAALEEPLDRRVADLVLLEAFVERDDVRVRVADRLGVRSVVPAPRR